MRQKGESKMSENFEYAQKESATDLVKERKDRLVSAGLDEKVFIQAHLAATEAKMRAADTSHLNNEQQTNRAARIEDLHNYWTEGKFPKNEDFPGERVPYFEDAEGTLCAMAELIECSGRRDIVDHVASTRNNAYVRELADEPALIEWLDVNGMAVEEAALVQPSYGGGGWPPPRPMHSQARTVALIDQAAGRAEKKIDGDRSDDVEQVKGSELENLQSVANATGNTEVKNEKRNEAKSIRRSYSPTRGPQANESYYSKTAGDAMEKAGATTDKLFQSVAKELNSAIKPFSDGNVYLWNGELRGLRAAVAAYNSANAVLQEQTSNYINFRTHEMPIINPPPRDE